MPLHRIYNAASFRSTRFTSGQPPQPVSLEESLRRDLHRELSRADGDPLSEPTFTRACGLLGECLGVRIQWQLASDGVEHVSVGNPDPEALRVAEVLLRELAPTGIQVERIHVEDQEAHATPLDTTPGPSTWDLLKLDDEGLAA